MPWAGFEPTSPWLPVGCDHHYTIRATMLATWPIWIANGNYVVSWVQVFSSTRWRWINQNDDSQADEREEENWRAGCKNLVSDKFGRFSVLLKTSPNFASWLEMNLRTLPWYFFYRCELYFWEISYRLSVWKQWNQRSDTYRSLFDICITVKSHYIGSTIE